MLGSLNSSSSHDQEEEDKDHHHHHHQQFQQQIMPLDLHFRHYHQQQKNNIPLPAPPLPLPLPQAALLPIRGYFSNSASTSTSLTASIHLRQLLVRCAELISQSDFSTANQVISILSSNSSPHGDSTERLTHHLTKALALHLNLHHHYPQELDQQDNEPEEEIKALHSCYLSLNQVTPFIRFSHLTANQAILEAIELQGQSQPQPIHIIDFNVMHGVQWPPFMQALADRYNSSPHPPALRITATGNDLNTLQKTGDRLTKFAYSIGLRFQFHPLLLLNDDPTSLALYLRSAVRVLPDEALAVNCVLYLHRLIKEEDEDGRNLRLFLQKVNSLRPKVVTIAEREANHNHPVFMQRFLEALDHYSALFDSLEATLPPNSRERLEVERVWLGKEIMDILGNNGGGFFRRRMRMRKERHQRFETWERLMRSAGFSNVALSPFALSQAKLLLRLHYPSEGYHLQVINDSFFLGWHNRALFSVSSWH